MISRNLLFSRTSLFVLYLSGAFAVGGSTAGCTKGRDPAQDKTALPVPDATTTPTSPTTHEPSAVAPSPSVPQANNTSSPSANKYSCANNDIWRSLELKSLKTGKLQIPVEGVVLPTPVWRPCDGQNYCEQLVLEPSQRILALGQDGNKLRIVTVDRCGENTSITLGSPHEAANIAFRGLDMDFETAVLGGDRFLFGGFARHKSSSAENGFVRREVLVTAREDKFPQLESISNQWGAIPRAAASQLVRVKLGDEACTTMFWKLGVEQCDFRTQDSSNFALFGSNLIYLVDNVGLKWNIDEGSTELLPHLDWILTDGVNVAWATRGTLTVTQPRYDLPELVGKPAPGEAGPRPIAMGCGRLLSREDNVWLLRNIDRGSRWRLPDSKFAKAGPGAVVMDCDSIYFENGTRILLKGLGELESIPEAPIQ